MTKKSKKEKEMFWYSPVYSMNDCGFYVSKFNNKYYLGFKDENGKSTEVNINYVCFNILRKEWNL